MTHDYWTAGAAIEQRDAEIERLRLAIKMERGKTEKADEDNERLRSERNDLDILLSRAVTDAKRRDAEIERLRQVLQDFYDYGYDREKCYAALAADSASVCPFQGPGNSGYTPTLCPVCDNKLGRCTLTTADQPNAARKTVWKPYDVFGVTGRLVYEDTGEDVPDQPGEAAK